ncbi:MAG: riboflavin synthase [Clostridiales bacterium]|nr:riboflavin synthase [Clostridiales bacterium]
MFTGIVEEIGFIKKIDRKGQGLQLMISCHRILDDIKIGDSISTNGVCLTVTSFGGDYYTADVMPETAKLSTFNYLKTGESVNLERALALGNRFGGHMVSGHIDGIGEIIRKVKDSNATRLLIRCSEELLRYVVKKGSITLDGISLTVASLTNCEFEVSIIPQTKEETTLLSKAIGQYINIENDIVAKYIEKFMPTNKNTITTDFLKKNGFM